MPQATPPAAVAAATVLADVACVPRLLSADMVVAPMDNVEGVLAMACGALHVPGNPEPRKEKPSRTATALGQRCSLLEDFDGLAEGALPSVRDGVVRPVLAPVPPLLF